MRRFLLIAFIVSASPAAAGDIMLPLNDVGVAGLEQMLDVARRNVATMREADMAVSLYNALQGAKQSSAQYNAQRIEGLEKQIASLKAEVEKLKAVPEPKDDPQ